MKKIVIFNFFGYSGGALVLSQLCKTLRTLGYDAKLFMSPFIPWGYEHPFRYLEAWVYFYLNRVKKMLCSRGKEHVLDIYSEGQDVNSIGMEGLKFEWNPLFCRKNTIVIYPEIVYGNPLAAKNVVRWFLFHPQEKAKSSYGKSDVFIAYREIFNDESLNPMKHMCQITTFDSSLYHQYNFGNRTGSCYIIRKGSKRTDLPETFDGPILDNAPQREWVRVFNECKYCYSYDTQTFYTTIAAVCGCIPIIVMEPGKTEKDYLGSGERHPGRAYGDTADQIQYAMDTREELLRTLDYTERNRTNVQEFVNLLEEKFGKIKRIR